MHDDDIGRRPSDADYDQVLTEIGEFYNRKWLPVDRWLRNWLPGLAIGLGIMLFGDAFLRALGAAMVGVSALAMVITASVHNRRTRHLFELHQRALSMMRERL